MPTIRPINRCVLLSRRIEWFIVRLKGLLDVYFCNHRVTVIYAHYNLLCRDIPGEIDELRFLVIWNSGNRVNIEKKNFPSNQPCKRNNPLKRIFFRLFASKTFLQCKHIIFTEIYIYRYKNFDERIRIQNIIQQGCLARRLPRTAVRRRLCCVVLVRRTLDTVRRRRILETVRLTGRAARRFLGPQQAPRFLIVGGLFLRYGTANCRYGNRSISVSLFHSLAPRFEFCAAVRCLFSGHDRKHRRKLKKGLFVIREHFVRVEGWWPASMVSLFDWQFLNVCIAKEFFFRSNMFFGLKSRIAMEIRKAACDVEMLNTYVRHIYRLRLTKTRIKNCAESDCNRPVNCDLSVAL